MVIERRNWRFEDIWSYLKHLPLGIRPTAHHPGRPNLPNLVGMHKLLVIRLERIGWTTFSPKKTKHFVNSRSFLQMFSIVPLPLRPVISTNSVEVTEARHWGRNRLFQCQNRPGSGEGIFGPPTCMYGWMDGWMHGWMDVCMYGLTDGCMDVCIMSCNMYIYRHIHIHTHITYPIFHRDNMVPCPMSRGWWIFRHHLPPSLWTPDSVQNGKGPKYHQLFRDSPTKADSSTNKSTK